ncbi:prominin-2 isoform X1 [Takifugu rubripes]|uniref:Prominin 2 n=1 Tax=Takifugu rubripes TaxID=31033 RepID=H2TQU0_TAKRU|nr:prominin-3 isoform X1 [Takifugu rubripes]
MSRTGMSLCATMVGRSWQGYGLGGLLLLSLLQSASTNAACPPAVVPQNLSQPHYQNTTGDGVAGFVTAFVQSFLNTVQPNPFPQDLIVKLIQNVNPQQNQALIKEALVYQVGFLVCLVIGILYIVLMPLVGFFLACCRCCGNCGGKMYQKQTSSVHCRRRTLYWSLFLTTIVILIGNICMFQSNKALNENIDQGPLNLNRTINNIRTFLSSVPQQFNHVVDESYRTIQEVEGNLDDIGPQLGAEIQRPLEEALVLTLTSVTTLNNDTTVTSNQLNNLNSSLSRLQSSLNLLQANVTAIRNRINQTLSNANCIDCDGLRPELQNLILDTSISSAGLNEFQNELDDIIRTNLTSKINEVKDDLNSIPQTVTNDTRDVVQNSKKLLEDLRTEISQFEKDLPLSTLNDTLRTLEQVHKDILTFTPEVEKVENIRWTIFLIVSCVVLLVVLCNLLGLVLGPLGLRPNSQPTDRSCTADCGGTFFMMGAGFSFLFSWLFMIIVLLLFLLGGNVYTLICEPWKTGELLQFIDTPGVIPGLEIGPSLGLKDNLTISEIYNGCKEDKSLWTTLRLYEVIDLDELLNVTKYSEEIERNFENSNISLSNITLLGPEDKRRLQSFSDTTKDVDFNDVTQQVSNLSSINLTTTADKLDQLAQLQTNGHVQEALRKEARDLRKIQSEIEATIDPQLEVITSTIAGLRATVEKMNNTVGEVLNRVGATQDFLDANSTLIVKTESRRYLDCQTGYFTQYADWANLTITEQVGHCGPMAGTVDSAAVILCSQMVDSLNAFWFGLGWCLIFFIPSIIFSIKLAKYYRKMKYADICDDVMYLNHIPRAQPPLK